MNEIPSIQDVGSVKALHRIRQKVDSGVWPITGAGNFDKKPCSLDRFSPLTQFVQIRKPLSGPGIPDGFGVLVFSDDITHEDKMRRVKHDIAVTQFLSQSRKDGSLHPIVETVELFTFGNKKAHFLGKSIPARAGWFYEDNDIHAENVLRIFGYHFIPDELIKLNISTTKIGFDIRGGNIIMNSQFMKCLEDSRNRLTEIGELALLTNEGEEGRKLLADEWAKKGARIYLFDFGSWILPENS